MESEREICVTSKLICSLVNVNYYLFLGFSFFKNRMKREKNFFRGFFPPLKRAREINVVVVVVAFCCRQRCLSLTKQTFSFFFFSVERHKVLVWQVRGEEGGKLNFFNETFTGANRD